MHKLIARMPDQDDFRQYREAQETSRNYPASEAKRQIKP